MFARNRALEAVKLSHQASALSAYVLAVEALAPAFGPASYFAAAARAWGVELGRDEVETEGELEALLRSAQPGPLAKVAELHSTGTNLVYEEARDRVRLRYVRREEVASVLPKVEKTLTDRRRQGLLCLTFEIDAPSRTDPRDRVERRSVVLGYDDALYMIDPTKHATEVRHIGASIQATFTNLVEVLYVQPRLSPVA